MTTLVFPGQGAQFKGMGKDLFDRFPEQTAQADAMLGYSVRTLCLEDPKSQLAQTQFTQPALFIVNALSFLAWKADGGDTPRYLAGHSLGEFNALFAADAFSFEDGLRLVQERGRLMAEVSGGGMAAVLGLSLDRVQQLIHENALSTLDVANVNSPSQVVIGGPSADVKAAEPVFGEARAYVVLNVSGAFHSRYMQPASEAFAAFLQTVNLCDPKIPVISNVTAKPYRPGETASNLARQLTSLVQWNDTVRYLMGKGEEDFKEIGPGTVLTKLIKTIHTEAEPLTSETVTALRPQDLGNAAFRQAWGVKYAYLAGGMGLGVSGVDLVAQLAGADLMGFLGTDGLSVSEIEIQLKDLKARLGDRPYGVNLHPRAANEEEKIIDLLLSHGVRHVEAGGYLFASPALVKYRQADADNHLLAKVSHPDIGELFLAPLTPKNGGTRRPLADALYVMGQGGGLTDSGNLMSLLPAMMRLRDEAILQHGYSAPIFVGAGGGIGTPDAAAAAFFLGADFIETGSINQCSVEAAIDPSVKDMLQVSGIQDTEDAPAADMFEWGARVQVLKRGSFFSTRARKLSDIHRHFGHWSDVPKIERQRIEAKYLGRPFTAVQDEIGETGAEGKEAMAAVFKWYLQQSRNWAIQGDETRRMDYQIWSGPALGAFNQWVKGSDMEDWRQRYVDRIAVRLMEATAVTVGQKVLAFSPDR